MLWSKSTSIIAVFFENCKNFGPLSRGYGEIERRILFFLNKPNKKSIFARVKNPPLDCQGKWVWFQIQNFNNSMSVKLRLQRKGRKKRPFYHIVAADGRAPRDGRFIERLGSYNPMTKPATIEIDRDKAFEWIVKGAQPTDTVRAILRFKGIYYKKHLMRGVKKGAMTAEEAEAKYQEWIETKEAKIATRFEQTAEEQQQLLSKLSGTPPPPPAPEPEEEEAPAEEAAAAEGEEATAQTETADAEAPAAEEKAATEEKVATEEVATEEKAATEETTTEEAATEEATTETATEEENKEDEKK